VRVAGAKKEAEAIMLTEEIFGQMRLAQKRSRLRTAGLMVLMALGTSACVATDPNSTLTDKNFVEEQPIVMAAPSTKEMAPIKASAKPRAVQPTGRTLQVVGKGPGRAGRPVYICGPSGGGSKPSCYRL